jgi:hypothetical protein
VEVELKDDVIVAIQLWEALELLLIDMVFVRDRPDESDFVSDVTREKEEVGVGVGVMVDEAVFVCDRRDVSE